MCLYENILGNQFQALHPTLRRFHRTPATAHGRFRVWQPKNPFAKRLSSWMGFPDSGDNIAVKLEVEQASNQELWRREFGSTIVETVQTASGGKLMERAGSWNFASELEVRGGSLHFRSTRFCWRRLALPARIAPLVTSRVTPDDDGWDLIVHVESPVFGTLLKYEGYVWPDGNSN